MLAVVNTNITGIRDSHVMLSEMVLISVGLLLALDRRASLYIVLTLYLSYMAFILSLRPELDLKAIRDILIPLVFYSLGRKVERIEDADRIVFLSAYLVLTVGLFEFLFLDLYTSFVNIFEYYVARGTLTADSNFVEGSNLFISSTRIGGRNFLPFLGNIRASSVFLEPVTMGNYGAFLCLWAFFRRDMAWRWLLLALGFTVIILGDARFGLFVTFALFAVGLVHRALPRAVLWLAPFFVALLLILYGGWTNQVHWEDNLPGRVLSSAMIMAKLDWRAYLGIALDLPFVDDNGYAYSFSQIGVVGAAFLWAIYIFASSHSEDAGKFKALATVFICLLLVVSNSIYSIKLAALFWFCAGAADIERNDRSEANAGFASQAYRASA
ncbi:UDP-phosphate alpha N-acetylglucosaminyltransferase [uncultured Roseibium sp.]|uniref:UDP-phosphate alpha N-acetylglucosaminyltransferase n=1 Tax=uncultured Roseibium sp. TaxID=1936171 RepID=UPI003217E106